MNNGGVPRVISSVLAFAQIVRAIQSGAVVR